MEAGPRSAGEGDGRPTLGVLLTVFQRSQFYGEALRSVAEQFGTLPNLEIVVVSSSNVKIGVPDLFKGRGWTVRIVTSEAVGEGPFLADGLRALRADVVVPLDDDDLWAPGRLAAVQTAFAQRPDVAYYHNGQSFVDAAGRPVPRGSALRHLRRYAGTPSGPVRFVSSDRARRRPGALARWGSAFNNSSVAIRRSALEGALPELGRTQRLIDSFMFYAGASSGGALAFDPSPWTAYRIHEWNRSRGERRVGATEVAMPSLSRAGRLASLEAMRALVVRRGADWLVPWVDRDLAYFDLLEGLREGESDRGTTLGRLARLARYARYSDPVMNAVLGVMAVGQAAFPRVAHRAYWGKGPTAAGAPGPSPRG